ncbi:hypothetical protein ACKKBG_A11805 [Auxenochlorella protothecoides x Auxenochlorella symbiontica]
MGRPLLTVCAAENCETFKADEGDGTGVFLDVSTLFAKGVPSTDTMVWCCCTDHKRATVALIMKELPYKTFIKADETNLAPNYPPLPLAARMAMRLYNPC